MRKLCVKSYNIIQYDTLADPHAQERITYLITKHKMTDNMVAASLERSLTIDGSLGW